MSVSRANNPDYALRAGCVAVCECKHAPSAHKPVIVEGKGCHASLNIGTVTIKRTTCRRCDCTEYKPGSIK